MVREMGYLLASCAAESLFKAAIERTDIALVAGSQVSVAIVAL